MSWCLFGEYGNAIVKSNFVNNHIRLNGNVHGHKLRLCNKCEEMKPPEGGVQMSAARWICASCWTNRVTSQNLKEMVK
jgi:hypothetical protein